MKKVTVLFSMLASLASLSAFAYPTASDSWDTIRSFPGLIVMPGSSYDSNFGPEGIFNSCVDGDSLKSIAPVQECTQSVTIHGQGPAGRDTRITKCVASVDVNVSLPIEQQIETCGSWVRRDRDTRYCAKYDTTSFSIPLTYNLRVVAGFFPTTLFYKPFAIPACNP